MRRITLAALEFLIREWWFTNTVAWIGVVAFVLWFDGWFT